jgi:RHS repeat-associated protein
MNLRFSFFWRPLVSLICAQLLCVFTARAVNHNPYNGGDFHGATVSLSNGAAVPDGSGGFTVTVDVDVDGDARALSDQNLTLTVTSGSMTPKTKTISSAGQASVTITPEDGRSCNCSFSFELTGLTSGEKPSAGPVDASASGGNSPSGGGTSADVPGTGSSGDAEGGGGVRASFAAGSAGELGKGSAGTLLVAFKTPSEKMYRPEGISAAISPNAENVVYASSGAVRQILAKDKLTDVVSTSAEGYEIREYPRLAVGSQDSSGLYTIIGSATRVTAVENPGGVEIVGTTDDDLFRNQRWGDKFNYAFDVPNGYYRIDLDFAELNASTSGKNVFDVSAQGVVKLSSYDPILAAGGKFHAKRETIYSTVQNGVLSLDFTKISGGAHVAAVKVTSDAPAVISNTSDTALYQTARQGDFVYQLPLDDGNYSVTLYFAETTFEEAGKRTFNVTFNGAVVLSDYDIFSQAGSANKAVTETIPVVITSGQLTIATTSIIDQSRLSALLVRDTATNEVVAAINVGGPSFTDGESVVFQADTLFTGGTVVAPGALFGAINAGGGAYTTSGVAYMADQSFSGGTAFAGGYNQLRMIVSGPGQATMTYGYQFTADPQSGKFDGVVLNLPGGAKKEGRQTIWSSDRLSYEDVVTLYNANDTVAYKQSVHYERLRCGWRKVRDVLDPDGAAITTTWTYEEGSANPADPKPDGYGLVKSEVGPDGSWKKYSYDSQQRLTRLVSGYLNSAFGVESQARVETYAYSTVNPIETHVTTVRQQEVARDYVATVDHEATHESERHIIKAVSPGALWDDSSNLVNKTNYYTSDHPETLLRGQIKWTQSPDGSMTFYAYSRSGDNVMETREAGAPNSSRTSVIDGTRTVTTTNPQRQKIAEDVIDIASGLTLSTWDALSVDSLGRPTEIGYGDGTTRSMTYVGSSASCGSCSGSGNFLVESETDRNGVTTTYAYDALNRRTDTTRLGVTEHLVYDAAGRVTERHRIGTDDSDITLSATTYDLAGRMTVTADALGNETTYAYSYPSGGGMTTTTTNPATAAGSGTRIETTYADGRTKEISGTAVSPMKYAYGTWSASGAAGEWTQEIKVGESSSETEWTKTYADLAGRTTKMEYADSAYATMAYNALGQLVKQTDPDGVRTLYAYNTKGEREVTAIDLDQDDTIDYTGTDRITKSVRDVYSKSGTIVSRTTTQVWATDNSNTTTTVSVAEQDGYGNQSWQTDAAGAVASTTIVRTAAGAWTITAIAPDGSRRVQTYSSGRLISSEALSSSLSAISSLSYAYDAHNRVETQTDARTGDSDYTYTDRDQVLSVTANNGTETTAYAYDALGNQLTITRPDSSVTTNEYHLRNNQLKKVSGSLTYPVEYTYDPQGRMKTLTTWQNATSSTGAAVTTWNYDTQRGWLTQKLYADSTGPAYTYTDAGRLETRTWVRTVSSSPLVTTYTYNTLGDLTSTDYSDTTPDVSLTYTRFGAQKTVTDATGTRTFTYTAALRPDQEQLDATYYGSRILTRTYETGGATIGRSTGFLLGVTADPDQDYAVTYAYDTSGRLSTVTDPSSTYTYGYTTNSNLRHTLTGPVHVATTTYETYRDVIDIVENKVGTTSISKYDYTVNNLGQRTQRANTGSAFGTTSTDVFAYNAKGEVTGSTNATIPAYDRGYSYDDIGNRVGSLLAGASTSYTANTLNQYTAIASATPTYDADGNQTFAPAGTSSSTSPLNYIWDAENRLVLIEPVSPTTGDKKQLNVYDAQSRRVRKQVSTYVSGSWSLTTDEKFIYDGWNVVAVLNAASSNALLRTYTWGMDLSGSLQGAGGVGGLLSVKDGSSVYHYTYDANGNVSEVLNNSGGIAAHYEYDAFGNTVASSGTYALTNVYRFSTKPLDATSGLYYYGFRYYNPSTGRWPSRDPLGERGGTNLYLFCENVPTSSIDRLGLDTIRINYGFDSTAQADKKTTDWTKKNTDNFKNTLTSCCRLYQIGCNTDVKASYNYKQVPASKGDYGPNDPGRSQIGKSGNSNSSVNVLVTNKPMQGGAQGWGGSDGVAAGANSPDDNLVAHETGHTAGYDKGDLDGGTHNSDPNNPMSTTTPSGQSNPDKCWCEKVVKLAK